MLEKIITLLKSLGCLSNIVIKLWQFLFTLYRPWQIRTYLKANPIRKMQIGTGTGKNAIRGWLNTDFIPRTTKLVFLDVTKTFPLEDNTFDYIFAEEVLEHLIFSEGTHMLLECFRVLKPNGRIRFTTPDLHFLVSLYRPEKTELQKKYISHIIKCHLPTIKEIYPRQEIFVINNNFRAWGHKFIYDYDTLNYVMSKIGFIEIKRYSIRESDDENLRGLECHDINYEPPSIREIDLSKVRLIIEGKKPVKSCD
jgi:predicted SAM-dependent methyltransferase